MKRLNGNFAILLICVLLYFFNNLFLKLQSTIFQEFFIGYFNDLLAPIFVLAYTNILLKKRGYNCICKLIHILILCILGGIIWEVVAVYIKPTSVFDYFDFVAYMLGGFIYYILYKKKVLK